MLREERSTRITQIFYFRFCQFLAEKTSHIFGAKRADFVTTKFRPGVNEEFIEEY